MGRQPWNRYGLLVHEGANDQGAGMADATAAAEARMANAGTIVDNAGDGAETPPAPEGPAEAEFPGVDFSSLSYQDGKKLEKELRADREKWRPYAETFGALDDDARNAILESAPDLGGDLAFISRAFAGLQPGDRQVIANLAELVNSDPAAAAEGFAQAAAILRGEEVGGPAPEAGAADQPLTRAEMEQFYAQKTHEAESARAFAQAQTEILAEAKTLGYDPDSDDKTEKARFQFLIAAAGQSPDGDLAKAHELVQAYEQSRIDQFVAGKRADASRPSAPTAGAMPSPQEDEAATMPAALDRAKARLEEALGPLRR